MHLKKRLQLFLTFSAKQFNCQNDQANQENKYADAIDTMHVPNPFLLWPVWVFLF